MQDLIVLIVVIAIIAIYFYLVYKQSPSQKQDNTIIINDQTPASIKQDRFFKNAFKDDLIKLLTIEIYIDDNNHSSVLAIPLRADMKKCEYIRIALHYFSKMLFNFDPNDKDMRLSAETQKHALAQILEKPINKNSNFMLLADIADMVTLIEKPNENSSVIVATLYSLMKPMRHLRHITTTIPPIITTQKIVFSTIILFQAVLNILDDEEIKILEKAMKYMNQKYMSGYDYSSPNALELANQAYLDSI